MSGIILAFGLILSSAMKPAPVIDTIICEEAIVESREFELPDDFEYFCRCVEAEAGDHDYLGKCYVADVILNRMEQWNLESLTAVINQKNQFEVVSNGRIWKVEVSEETRKACMDELKERKRTDILYFCMYDWFDWAEHCLVWPKDRPNNCHHYYTDKKKEKESE